MRTRHLLLIILSLAALFLAVGCLNPPANEAFAAPYAVDQEATTTGTSSSDSPLLSALPVSPADRQRFEELAQILTLIETGQEALSLIKTHDIDVLFQPGNGSRFNPNTNQIIIDSTFESYAAALILIHEVTHARYFHEGLAADVHLDGRKAYALKKVEEEMLAVASNIEAKMELAELGVDISGIESALYYTYRGAYGTAYRAAKWDNPGIDEASLKTIGREAGRAAVLEALMNGQAVTSNTHESYLEYWQAEWDKKHDTQ